MSKIFVDQVDPKTATTLTLGTSGDTVDIPTGVGLSVTDEVKTNKISPATGTAFALGDSGDTFTVPSGATIVNSGTATGFGDDNLPAFASTNSANQAISDGTFTKVAFNSEIYDSNTAYDTTNYRFTPGVAGKYFFYVDISGYSNADDGISLNQCAIYLNDAVAYQNYINYGSGEQREPQSIISGVIDLNTTDYIEAWLKVNYDGASSYNLQGGTKYNRFGAFKIAGS